LLVTIKGRGNDDQVSMLTTPLAQVRPFLEELTDHKILRRQPWHHGGVWLIIVCWCVWWWLIVVCVSFLAQHVMKPKLKVHNRTLSSIFNDGILVWTLGSRKS
jgi:hypothetical protein